jgi:competence protein ComEC
MPLVAHACLAYAAGAFLALVLPARLAPPIVGLALLLGAAMLLVPDAPLASPSRALTTLLLAGGALLGTASRVARASCDRQDPSPAMHAVIEHDVHAGDVVRTEVEARGCRTRATLLVQGGSAAAGDRVRVTGRVERRGDRLLVRDARLERAARPRSLAPARARVGARIDRVFGADAPLVRALVIADMARVPVEQRDRFARAGLVHMLSVSGLHVGIVALALELLAMALRLPQTPARLATMLVLVAYVLLIGAPPPAVRAAVMLGLLLLTRLLQRPTSVWAVLAVGATVPLLDPVVVLDLGWQLSVAGTVALVAGAALARRILPRGWRGVPRALATAAVVSVTATLATAPLVAWTFGRLSLVGPLSNLVADPVMGLLQPVLFLALLAPVPGLERLAADAAHLLLAAFDAIAGAAAALPFAAPRVLPTVAGAIAAAVAAVAFVVACLSRAPARAVVVATGALAVMTLEPLVRRPAAHTELHMLDVGQGDALAVRTRAGRWIVIDAGRSWPGGDAGRSTLVPFLAHRGGDVALFVLSHPHADHVGGAASLIESLHPDRLLDPGFVGTSPPYRAALTAAHRAGTAWQRVRPGDSLVVDEVVLTALAPDSAWASRLDDANLASTVVMARIGAVRVLLTGDAEGPEEEWLLAHAGDALRADVLKVAHHGSRTSTTAAFLEAVRPRVALVSVGAGNRYGHPAAAVMRALAESGADVLRTDQLGTVVLRTDGRTLEADAGGRRWTIPLRAPR